MSDRLTSLMNRARTAWRVMIIFDAIVLIIASFLSFYLFYTGEMLLPIILLTLASIRLLCTWLNNPDLI